MAGASNDGAAADCAAAAGATDAWSAAVTGAVLEALSTSSHVFLKEGALAPPPGAGAAAICVSGASFAAVTGTAIGAEAIGALMTAGAACLTGTAAGDATTLAGAELVAATGADGWVTRIAGAGAGAGTVVSRLMGGVAAAADALSCPSLFSDDALGAT